MFVVVKRKVVLLIVIIMAFCLVCPTAVFTIKKISPGLKNARIVIDAGHGGIDYGVQGITTKVKESDLTLELSKLINGYAESGGLSSTLTRKNSDGLYGLPLPNFKRRDMNKRLKIIREANPEVVISIHMNYYSEQYRRGIQVFYSKDSDTELAECVQSYLNRTMNMPTLNRNFSKMKGDYFVSKESSCPSIIIECGFLSNPNDEALMLDPEYRMLLAYQIFSAVVLYLETKLQDN